MNRGLGGGLRCINNGVLLYDGEFKNEIIHGIGTFIDQNGSTFKGHFRDGLLYGIGSFISSDGESYKGDYKSGLKDGIGTYNWKNNDKYTGALSSESNLYFKYLEAVIEQYKWVINCNNDQLVHFRASASFLLSKKHSTNLKYPTPPRIA